MSRRSRTQTPNVSPPFVNIFSNNGPVHIRSYTGTETLSSAFTPLALSFYHLPAVLCPGTLKGKCVYIEITVQTAAAQMPDTDYFFKEGAHLANISSLASQQLFNSAETGEEIRNKALLG